MSRIVSRYLSILRLHHTQRIMLAPCVVHVVWWCLSYTGESQKAFNLLQKRLKPLEHYQPVPYDFYNLAYLTSASTVHDAPGFRDWAGAAPERERLIGMWRELTEGDGLTDCESASFR
jgi:hypothetical protein